MKNSPSKQKGHKGSKEAADVYKGSPSKSGSTAARSGKAGTAHSSQQTLTQSASQGAEQSMKNIYGVDN